MDIANVLALAGVLIILGVHVAVISQWAGKISAGMESIESTLTEIQEVLSTESERRQSLSESVARIDARLSGLVIESGRLEERVISLERRQWKNDNSSSFQK